MPNGVADALWVALVCWALTTFTLLDRLAPGVCEGPEGGYWLIDATQKVILGLTLVMHTTEGFLAFIGEGVPEGPLWRGKSLRTTWWELASEAARWLGDAAL